MTPWIALLFVAAEPPPVTVGGYAEAYYGWNFNAPSNGITDFRGFDNRHNSITLENVALSASWDHENVLGVVALQVGAAPATYYLAEPALAGAAGANATGAGLLQFVQQANVGYRFPLLEGLVVNGGVFLSPVGPESIAVKDGWFWSRSDLFFGLPFYHSGLRASLTIDGNWSVGVMVSNGWNDIVDNNDAKSVTALVGYAIPDKLTTQVLYFGGAERARGSPEGDGSLRHLFDAYATWNATPWLALQVQADTGFEPNTFGTSSWLAGAIAARVQPLPWLYLAGRFDGFTEHAAQSDAGAASHIFWPVNAVGSATGTVELRPAEKVSFRLETRHDQADGNLFFGGDVEGDGTAVPFVPNRATQDTVTLGVTAWF